MFLYIYKKKKSNSVLVLFIIDAQTCTWTFKWACMMKSKATVNVVHIRKGTMVQ